LPQAMGPARRSTWWNSQPIDSPIERIDDLESSALLPAYRRFDARDRRTRSVRMTVK